MGVVVGLFLMLFGMIYFYAGGGWTIIASIWAGRLSETPPGPQVVFAGVGFAIWLLGAVVIVASTRRRRGKKTLTLKVLEHGVVVDGVVAAVSREKNRAGRVAVEFTFLDLDGDSHSGRDAEIDAGLAGRLGLQKGSRIQVKYLPGRPEKSILLLD
jgi:hypothetical protein